MTKGRRTLTCEGPGGSISILSGLVEFDISDASSYSASGCTPVEIPASVLYHLLRFPRLSKTCLARRTVPVPREALFVTGLNGRGPGWCFPCTSGSRGAFVKDGGSSGVTGAEEEGELALLLGSLGESSGTVTSRQRETCSVAETSCEGVVVTYYGQIDDESRERERDLRYEGWHASWWKSLNELAALYSRLVFTGPPAEGGMHDMYYSEQSGLESIACPIILLRLSASSTCADPGLISYQWTSDDEWYSEVYGTNISSMTLIRVCIFEIIS